MNAQDIGDEAGRPAPARRCASHHPPEAFSR
jgi:hypothetical protein